jgi:arylsulfatase A-like enzyme
MTEAWNGRLAVDIRDAVPDWAPFEQPKAPAEAPNVLMIVWDDVGYGAWDVSGGPIEVPTLRRIRDMGVQYSNFHTTALCSPTRASLLTGRNATSNGMACIAEATTGFPGSSGRIPFENGLISEVLGERGWNTYCVGKWHLTPEEETDLSSWRKRWPLGRGFERFYGFLGGETSQWYPDLVYDNHPIEPPGLPEDGYHLSKDLAEHAIQFIQDAKAAAPGKPFFLYLAPGCAHAPHHVFTEWADRYQGRFDMGYEAIRSEILGRQTATGLLPPETVLSPLNPHGEPDATGPKGQPWPQLDFVRPWDSLSDDEQRLFVRMAEVYAGFVSYTDEQIGRVLDYLEGIGELDNTIIVATSDNGSSAEGGPNGTFNENKFFNGVADTVESNLPRLHELGTPSSYNHYCSGWAWAFDTPFPYWKRYAGYEGGTAHLCLVAWPARVEARGAMRHQYVHAVDIVPTIYDLLDVTPPETLNGYTQSPLEGESIVPSILDSGAPGRSTQFYSMLGQRAIYHDGWLANTVHPTISGWSSFDADRWELYNLAQDRSQSSDLAASNAERLRELVELWWYWAGVYQALPLDDRSAVEVLGSSRPQPAEPADRYRYAPGASPIPEAVAVNIRGRSYTIAAGVVVDGSPDGILFQQGTLLGGHMLYLEDGTLRYTYNWLGEDIQRIAAPADVSPGRHVYTAEFSAEGRAEDNPSTVGTLTIYADETQLARASIRTQPGKFGLGSGLCVGRGLNPSPDPQRPAPGSFTGGHVEGVVVDVSGDAFVDHDLEVQAWLARD